MSAQKVADCWSFHGLPRRGGIRHIHNASFDTEPLLTSMRTIMLSLFGFWILIST